MADFIKDEMGPESFEEMMSPPQAQETKSDWVRPAPGNYKTVNGDMVAGWLRDGLIFPVGVGRSDSEVRDFLAGKDPENIRLEVAAADDQ